MYNIIALFGKSGAGKDTIMNELCSFYPNLHKLVRTTSRPKREGEENVVLALRRTDRSGKTTPITIETPDIRYSLTPQSETVPFTSVDVRVEHPSAYTAISENVQIFPGQVSLENVMLLPLEDNETDKNKKEITIVTPQDL